VILTSVDNICVISSPNPTFDHLLEPYRWDNPNKKSNKIWWRKRL